MKIFFLFILIIFSYPSLGQFQINGKVVDKHQEGIPGANVYLQGSYDGTAADASGYFEFNTDMENEQTLTVSCLGYETFRMVIKPGTITQPLSIILKEKVSEIDEVVITAGAFSAGDKSRAAVLKPLDIVSTAGATADIAGVMNTLPGTQTSAENGRLYVRGGDSREASAYIDGLLVSEPFSVAPGNVPSRFRFSPFLFKGTYFSTGGYSAEYGQALSSVLVLNTSDQSQRTQTDIGLMSLGIDVSQTLRFDKSSLVAQLGYTDLGLYYAMVPHRYHYEVAPKSWGGSLHYKVDLSKNTYIKWYNNFQLSDLKLKQPSFEDVHTLADISLNDNYGYSNLSFKTLTKYDWILRGGLAFSYLNTLTRYNTLKNRDKNRTVHAKLVADKPLGDHATFKAGTEMFRSDIDYNYQDDADQEYDINLTNYTTALFSEFELTLNRKLALKPGGRIEYSSINKEFSFSPRLSFAFRTGKKSQLSFALGRFYQLPDNQYVKASNQLNNENADHYILNYQYNPEGRILRLEAYHKKYDNLVSFNEYTTINAKDLGNAGHGHSSGLEVFWRDSKSLPGLDYWISYSYLDAKRKYLDYPDESIPDFAPAHNFSVVGKYYIMPLRTLVGTTYQFTSGRFYDDPNTEAFNDQKMKLTITLVLTSALFSSQISLSTVRYLMC